MTTVVVVPLPSWCRSKPRKVWPQHPPIFPDGEPSQEDRELAAELIAALDQSSQDWYRNTTGL